MTCYGRALILMVFSLPSQLHAAFSFSSSLSSIWNPFQSTPIMSM